MIKYETTEQYYQDCDITPAEILIKIKDLIEALVPDAVHCIAYNMPAFKYHKKPLVYFAAFKNHIGFYALPSGTEAFQTKLKSYKTGKGSIQFPLDQEIPYDLIEQIVRFRVAEVEDGLRK